MLYPTISYMCNCKNKQAQENVEQYGCTGCVRFDACGNPFSDSNGCFIARICRRIDPLGRKANDVAKGEKGIPIIL